MRKQENLKSEQDKEELIRQEEEQKKYGMFGTDLADFQKRMIDKWRAAGFSDERIRRTLEAW